MKSYLLRIAAFAAAFLALGCAGASSKADPSRIQIFGAEHLAIGSAWGTSGGSFTAATLGHDAVMNFTQNTWTALIGSLPIGRMTGSFTTHIRLRWIGDLSADHGASATVQYSNTDQGDLPGGANVPIPVNGDWQDVTVTSPIPKNATTVRFDIDCGAGGQMEISDYDLYLDNADLTTDAVKGVPMPWLTVPGGAAALGQVDSSAAVAQNVPDDPTPYSFDSPVWNGLKTYDILPTTTNKTPINDVSANFQVAWTSTDLFVRFHAHDRILHFTERSRFSNDVFEFFMQRSGGAADGARGLTALEHYAVTMTPGGQPSANTDAIVRKVSEGWEAIMRIPLQGEDLRTYPFNGFVATFNATYDDADTQPQEHWLSFSKADQDNNSWRDTSVYVPLVFATDQNVAFKPFFTGTGDVAYNVAPTFPGKINLVRTEGVVTNVDYWDVDPESRISAYVSGGHNVFVMKFPNDPRVSRTSFTMSPFNVLAGETIEVTGEARASAGASFGFPGPAFLSESSWSINGAAPESANTVGQDWGKVAWTITLPDTQRNSIRNGRLIWTLNPMPGRTVELRDLRVTRRTPADFDALITVPGKYSHFWAGEPNILHFEFASGKTTSAKVTATVVSYFSNKVLLSKQWTKSMPEGNSSLDWSVASLPYGFFNVLLKVRDANGGFLADRELYVTKSQKDTRLSKFSGIFQVSNLNVFAPATLSDQIAQLEGIGVGFAQFASFNLFDNHGNIRGPYPIPPLTMLKAYHAAGFDTGWCYWAQPGPFPIGRNWEPLEMLAWDKKFMTATKGLFTSLSFGNETNLYGGWNPVPDAREWSMYERGWYNTLRATSPTTLPLEGAFNDIPPEYIKGVATENHQSFSAPIIGMHLYGLEVNGDGFRDDLAAREQIEKMHPGWKCWDIESGLVFYTNEGALDLQSKKEPIERCAGYLRTVYLDGYTYTFPLGDSSPLVPMEAFENRFYLDTTPVGRVTSKDGSTQVYLFRRANGQGIAAFWNTSLDPSSVVIPFKGAGQRFDVFGNLLGSMGAGDHTFALSDRFVNYAQGVDLAQLVKDPSFIAAFNNSSVKPATDPGSTTHVYMAVPVATRYFDREVQVGTPSDLVLYVRNDGASARTLKLSSVAPDGLKVSYGSHQSVTLKPQQTQIITAHLVAGTTMSNQPLQITGSLDDGLKVVPLLFSVSTAPPVEVAGYSRAIEFANHTAASADISTVSTKYEFVFQPGVVKQTVAPSAAATAPLYIAPNPSMQANFNELNTANFYNMSITSPQGTYTQFGHCVLFSPAPEQDGAVDFTNLPYALSPERPGSEPFLVDYGIYWAAGGGLRIVARVHDASPVQTGQNGYLKEGGDCMLASFDPDASASPTTFGTNYHEVGFAFSHGAPTSYIWDGKNGLEASTPFPQAVNKISRDADYIYYDVTIPQDLIQQNGGPTAGMTIAFVDKGADGSTQTIQLGQGLLPVRDPAQMGLLLEKK